MFAILILHALILQYDDNVEILPNPNILHTVYLDFALSILKKNEYYSHFMILNTCFVLDSLKTIINNGLVQVSYWEP